MADGYVPQQVPGQAEASGTGEKPAGFVRRLRARLNRGNSWLTYDLANLLPAGQIDDATLDELETRLVSADVGLETSSAILDGLRGKVARRELGDIDALLAALRASMLAILRPVGRPLSIDRTKRPFVILVVGVNGSGQDHDDRQARPAVPGRRTQGHARGRRYLPRRRDRAARDLG